jgi:uncharacterized protein YbjQ (UPF0145 family)
MLVASVRSPLMYALMLAGAALAGCVPLTEEGAAVHVVDSSGASPSADVKGCRHVGTITAYARSTKPGSPLTGNFAIARSNAENELHNNAADAGADTLVDVRTEDGFWGVDAT